MLVARLQFRCLEVRDKLTLGCISITITFNHCFSLWSFYAQWHCSGVHCDCVMFYCFTFPSHNNSAFIHNASNPIIRLNSVKILLSQNIFFILLSAKQTCRSWCCLLVRSRQHWREGGGQLVFSVLLNNFPVTVYSFISLLLYFTLNSTYYLWSNANCIPGLLLIFCLIYFSWRECNYF